MEESEKTGACESSVTQTNNQAGPPSNNTELIEIGVEQTNDDAEPFQLDTRIDDTTDHVWTPKEVAAILRKLGDNLDRRAKKDASLRAQKKG